MTQEEKSLLLKDLCARLPYGVKLNTPDGVDTLGNVDVNERWINASYDVDEVKPYLRPISSMTEEEKKELGSFVAASMFASQNKNSLFQLAREALYGDFFNKHHFDYRGLIEKGLALEAPEGMYDLKKK